MKKDSFEYVRPVLAIILFVIAFSLTLIVCFFNIPSANIQMVNIFIGFAWASASGAGGYYFGSSKGSTDKDNTIANSTPNIPATNTATEVKS